MLLETATNSPIRNVGGAQMLPALTWRARFCLRMGHLCGLLRGTHEARIPF